jgi:hypothetical protein
MIKPLRLILLVTLAIVTFSTSSKAAIPLQLTWQGVALDSNNAPLATGVYTLHFSIYSDDVGGDLLWTETQAILVENGVMSVNLGKLTPVPDSAFSTDSRFLEVQFEDQPPYSPRSRIVSVGYSYRTGSVDGALAGTLYGSLIVDGDIMTPALTVIDGGTVEVKDVSGNLASHITVGASGEGGVLSIASDASSTNGIILEGSAEGSGEPRFAIVGTQGAIEFDLREGSDLSLLLPPDAITSHEIKDEAGIATGFQPGQLSDIGSAYANIATATADFPAAGHVLVLLEATLRTHVGQAPIEAQLLEDGDVVAEWQWGGKHFDESSYNLQSYLFTKTVPGGAETYTLRIRRQDGTVDAADAKVVAVYLSTNYGTTPTTGGTSSYTFDADYQAQFSEASAIDVANEREVSLAANQARIEGELNAMAERMEELRAILKEIQARAGTEQ